MFKYYLKIFYNKNAPYKFNWAILFPLIGTAISTLSIVLIYCVMSSMEDTIKKAVLSTDGSTVIRLKNSDKRDYENDIKYIQEYLDHTGVENQRMISRPSILSFNGQTFFVTVVGLENLSYIKKTFSLSVDEEDFREGILIGEELSRKLGSPKMGDSLLVLSPLDSRLFINGKSFKCIEQRISFDNPNSIKNISGEYVYIDYNAAKSIFNFAYPYISINSEVSSKKIEHIKNKVSDISISDWKDENPLFFNAIKIEKILYSGFGILILLIVGFNVYGLINLIVLRKSNQLSLMLYMGASAKQVGFIFHYNIFLIGFIGSLVGAALSVLVLESNFLIIQGLLPSMIKKIDIYYPIIFLSIIFNLSVLYLSSKVSINKSIKNIGVLKSNAIEG